GRRGVSPFLAVAYAASWAFARSARAVSSLRSARMASWTGCSRVSKRTTRCGPQRFSAPARPARDRVGLGDLVMVMRSLTQGCARSTSPLVAYDRFHGRWFGPGSDGSRSTAGVAGPTACAPYRGSGADILMWAGDLANSHQSPRL